ncbi:MAG: hypothetical protein LQ350_005773 [Teloschistes chrysophthalmus]|nr:MAG: hypothetical protein LQ350_005773 [Niorma chrysophthalma]
MPPTKKRKTPNLLSHTRPPTFTKPSSLSSQATRSLIRKHHTLQKKLHTARHSGDSANAETLEQELASAGGLQTYQQASLQGQSASRGGDSSRVLVEWLRPSIALSHNSSSDRVCGGRRKLKMLEVGALRTDNACARSGWFDVRRIDLRAQHEGIEEVDFMEMDVPDQRGNGKEGEKGEGKEGREGYDIVSLSLVVNYVGDPVGRGEMLKRVQKFLRFDDYNFGEEKEEDGLVFGGGRELSLFPSLFLVLPAPCVMNSRYLDEERLGRMMGWLGYVRVKRKVSRKLVYYLWRYEGRKDGGGSGGGMGSFKKQEIRPGGGRNNFAIVLQ